MSTCGKNLSLKAYIDGKEASIEIPYQSLFELFEFRKQYEEYAKDVSTPVDYHEPEREIYDSAKLLVKHGVCSTELLQRHFSMGYGTAASIIDELENLGVITPVIGNKRFFKAKNEEELRDIFKKQIALNVVQLKDMRSAIEVILKRKRCTTPLVQKSLDWGVWTYTNHNAESGDNRSSFTQNRGENRTRYFNKKSRRIWQIDRAIATI